MLPLPPLDVERRNAPDAHARCLQAGLLQADRDALHPVAVEVTRVPGRVRGEGSLQAPEVLGDQDSRTLRGVFIRAPYITEAAPDVEILALYQGKMVLARQGNLLASAFHPELTGDSQVHRYFLQQIVSKR